MIYLGVCLAIWGCPRRFLNHSVREQSSSNDQAILLAQVAESVAILLDVITPVLPHDLVAFSVLAYYSPFKKGTLIPGLFSNHYAYTVFFFTVLTSVQVV